MQLSDDELRDVLTRAEEIQRGSRTADTMQAEIEAVIGAGEAVGLTRPALERALRERLELVAAVAVTPARWCSPSPPTASTTSRKSSPSRVTRSASGSCAAASIP